METIGLRELNQNPSKAVARVRAGASLIVTDRGKPILRMIPEIQVGGPLAAMVSDGSATPPVERGMPDLIPDLTPEIDSLTALVLADRVRRR